MIWFTASDWLAAHAAAVQALASVVSVILAGILVWTTIRYARSTADILEESRKSRKAVELETGLRRILKSYFDYYERSRTHLSLGKDAPLERAIQPPWTGPIVAIPQVGGLHRRYERIAA